MSRCDLRKEAYKYVLQLFGRPCPDRGKIDRSLSIPLSEIQLLKEGKSDPSAALIASLKQLMNGVVADADIDAHLLVPFQREES